MEAPARYSGTPLHVLVEYERVEGGLPTALPLRDGGDASTLDEVAAAVTALPAGSDAAALADTLARSFAGAVGSDGAGGGGFYLPIDGVPLLVQDVAADWATRAADLTAAPHVAAEAADSMSTTTTSAAVRTWAAEVLDALDGEMAGRRLTTALTRLAAKASTAAARAAKKSRKSSSRGEGAGTSSSPVIAPLASPGDRLFAERLRKHMAKQLRAQEKAAGKTAKRAAAPGSGARATAVLCGALLSEYLHRLPAPLLAPAATRQLNASLASTGPARVTGTEVRAVVGGAAMHSAEAAAYRTFLFLVYVLLTHRASTPAAVRRATVEAAVREPLPHTVDALLQAYGLADPDVDPLSSSMREGGHDAARVGTRGSSSSSSSSSASHHPRRQRTPGDNKSSEGGKPAPTKHRSMGAMAMATTTTTTSPSSDVEVETDTDDTGNGRRRVTKGHRPEGTSTEAATSAPAPVRTDRLPLTSPPWRQTASPSVGDSSSDTSTLSGTPPAATLRPMPTTTAPTTGHTTQPAQRPSVGAMRGGVASSSSSSSVSTLPSGSSSPRPATDSSPAALPSTESRLPHRTSVSTRGLATIAATPVAAEAAGKLARQGAAEEVPSSHHTPLGATEQGGRPMPVGGPSALAVSEGRGGTPRAPDTDARVAIAIAAAAGGSSNNRQPPLLGSGSGGSGSGSVRRPPLPGSAVSHSLSSPLSSPRASTILPSAVVTTALEEDGVGAAMEALRPSTGRRTTPLRSPPRRLVESGEEGGGAAGRRLSYPEVLDVDTPAAVDEGVVRGTGRGSVKNSPPRADPPVKPTATLTAHSATVRLSDMTATASAHGNVPPSPASAGRVTALAEPRLTALQAAKQGFLAGHPPPPRGAAPSTRAAAAPATAAVSGVDRPPPTTASSPVPPRPDAVGGPAAEDAGVTTAITNVTTTVATSRTGRPAVPAVGASEEEEDGGGPRGSCRQQASVHEPCTLQESGTTVESAHGSSRLTANETQAFLDSHVHSQLRIASPPPPLQQQQAPSAGSAARADAARDAAALRTLQARVADLEGQLRERDTREAAAYDRGKTVEMELHALTQRVAAMERDRVKADRGSRLLAAALRDMESQLESFRDEQVRMRMLLTEAQLQNATLRQAVAGVRK